MVACCGYLCGKKCNALQSVVLAFRWLVAVICVVGSVMVFSGPFFKGLVVICVVGSELIFSGPCLKMACCGHLSGRKRDALQWLMF